MRSLLKSALGLALAASSCGPSQDVVATPAGSTTASAVPSTSAAVPVASPSTTPSAAPSTAPSASASVTATAPAATDVPPADVAERTKSNNAFGLALYTKLSGEKGDLFFAPASLSTALAMTYAGARGATADEMAKALRITLEPERLHRAFGAWVRDLSGSTKTAGVELRASNRLWGQKGYEFLSPFVTLLNDRYGAGFEELDFLGNAEASRAAINQWTQSKTEDKIKDLLAPGVIKPNTKLVLTNAIYFKGAWESRFKKEDTATEPFLADGKRKTNVPMMHQSGAFRYAERDGVQCLEMPYAGRSIAMDLLLPATPTGLGDLEKKLSVESLSGFIDALTAVKIEVAVPRFKVEREVELSSALKAMGMTSAFGAKADFSGMSGKGDLFLSAVVHKAYADVNEEGTEAAAATAVIATRKNGHSKPKSFKADHPFVLVIRDVGTGAILFLGRVTAPAPA